MTAILRPRVVVATWDVLPADVMKRSGSNVIIVDVPPGGRYPIDEVAEAVLFGMGKDPTLSTGNAGPVSLVNAWLSLGEHDHAVIVDAQLLPLARVAALLGWFSTHGVTPWLTVTSTDLDRTRRDVAGVLTFAAAMHAVEATIDELLEIVAGDPDAELDDPTTSELPRLPAADGFVFRSVCRDLLEPADFDRVDEQFVQSVHWFRSRLADIDSKAKVRPFEYLLKERAAATPDRDTFILQVRAAQVAGLSCGFHVQVSNTYMLGAVEVVHRLGLAAPHCSWERLNRYRDPAYGAVAALYSADIEPDAIAAMRVRDVFDPDPRGAVVVTIDRSARMVSAPQSRFLIAQRDLKRFDGAGDDDWLLGPAGPKIFGGRYVTGKLAKPAAEVGVSVVDGRVRSKAQNVTTWLRRHGITISKLSKHSDREAKAVAK